MRQFNDVTVKFLINFYIKFSCLRRLFAHDLSIQQLMMVLRQKTESDFVSVSVFGSG